ncbi:unnamed protein product [Nyctereutes procyonoides]|uniref:(raccoon dog) hypothetical protein n=1 Tax=Nyctereutes procyonoides TaxID=34880 RepID=A0A811YMA9_NYCPR|nr:unnamed protein product [Nyctereutes procyonoides]
MGAVGPPRRAETDPGRGAGARGPPGARHGGGQRHRAQHGPGAAAAGVQVVAVSRSQAHLDSLVRECPGVEPVCVDLADREATERALGSVRPVDLLEASFDVNLRAVIQVSQIVARGLIARGAPGSINSQPQRLLPHQGCHGLRTKVMALELGPHEIRVNTVNPTVVMTPMGQANWSNPQKAKTMLDRIPLGKFAEVENVVDTILFLLSDRSSMTTGSAMPVDGGFLVT